MTTKEYKKEHSRAAAARDLEETQLVSLDDLKELEQLQLARAAAPERARHRAVSIAAGIVLGLVLAVVLLAVFLMRVGGHS